MFTVAYSIGYNMKNRSVQLNWTTLNCHTHKTLSMSYHCPKRRNFGALLMHSSRNKQKSCSIIQAEPGIQHRLHISASYRTIVNFNAAIVDQTSHLSGNDSIFDFWDIAFVGLAAIGVAIGLITSQPSYEEDQKFLQLEGMDNKENRLALPNVGIEYCGGMKADIEMTLHQPPKFHEHVKTVNAISTDSQATYLKNNISRTKPYDVSQYVLKIDNTFHFYCKLILPKNLQISVRAIKGGRVTMEDEYFVADGGRFVAVFDGHGGGGVSQYLKNHLYDAVSHHVQIKHWEESDALLNRPSPSISGTACDTAHMRVGSDKETPSVFSFAAALKSAFGEIEQNVLENDTFQFQGSTAVAVLIHEKSGINSGTDTTGTGSPLKHRTLLSANIGDSRAVLSRNGRAVNLTRDHKPNDDQEKSRILAMGETIEWDRVSKVHRVRNLSLSRAIGDRYAKPVVSGEVEINHYPIIDQSDEFILLASDGLWDVMTSNEVVEFVHEKIEKELSSINIAKGDLANFTLVLRRNMAKFVAREAIRRGSSDNVCVVMVWLDDIG